MFVLLKRREPWQTQHMSRNVLCGKCEEEFIKLLLRDTSPNCRNQHGTFSHQSPQGALVWSGFLSQTLPGQADLRSSQQVGPDPGQSDLTPLCLGLADVLLKFSISAISFCPLFFCKIPFLLDRCQILFALGNLKSCSGRGRSQKLISRENYRILDQGNKEDLRQLAAQWAFENVSRRRKELRGLGHQEVIIHLLS